MGHVIIRLVTETREELVDYEVEALIQCRLESQFGLIGGACDIRVCLTTPDEVTIYVYPPTLIPRVIMAVFFISSYRGRKCRMILKSVSNICDI